MWTWFWQRLNFRPDYQKTFSRLCHFMQFLQTYSNTERKILNFEGEKKRRKSHHVLMRWGLETAMNLKIGHRTDSRVSPPLNFSHLFLLLSMPSLQKYIHILRIFRKYWKNMAILCISLSFTPIHIKHGPLSVCRFFYCTWKSHSSNSIKGNPNSE